MASLAATCDSARAQTLTVDDTRLRDEAILRARAGEYREPVAVLESLRDEYPDDLSLTHDLVTVLAWSEDDMATLAHADSLDPAAAPRYTQLAVAKAARNLQRFDAAAAWYDAALANDAEDLDALAGRIMTAADAGDAVEVRRMIDASTELEGVELDLARGYGYLSLGNALPALDAYDRVLATNPESFDALRGKALVLRSMLLPTQALALAARNPGILSDVEIERLEADEAAIRIRLTTRTPYPETSVYEGQDRTLALLDAQIEAATTSAGRNALLLDRVVALSDANDAAGAIAQFESLPAAANRDQVYVLTAAARAYLRAQQPGEALALLQRAQELAPDNIEIKFDLVYAWLDLERYDEAFALTQELTSTLPMTNQVEGQSITAPNRDRMRAELLAGIAEAYGDQLAAAQARFEALLAEAPNNAELRQELANVYRWRGWLDRSLNEYRQVLTTNDDLLGAELGHAHALLDARDYARVEQSVTTASATYGREPAVHDLAERWELHNKRELFVSASSGDSSGPIAGSNNYTIDARWFTKPLAYRYRALVATHDAYGQFPEGESRRRRIGAGVEYRAPRFTITGLASTSRSGGTDVGLAAEVGYRLNDFWSLGAGFEHNSDRVQLRAHRLGIETDRTFARASFAPNELSRVGFGFEHHDYSDDNVIQTLSADGRYRLVNRPRSKLYATGEVSLSRADSDVVPYYSPTRDRSVAVGAIHSWRIHRRYERTLTQEVGVSTGRHFQRGFQSGSTWAVRYRIDWSLSQSLDLSFGAERHGQFFDGLREHTTVGTIAIRARF